MSDISARFPVHCRDTVDSGAARCRRTYTDKHAELQTGCHSTPMHACTFFDLHRCPSLNGRSVNVYHIRDGMRGPRRGGTVRRGEGGHGIY